VKVTDKSGNPVEGASINFSISSQPSGAGVARVTHASASTDASGEAKTELILGTKSGSYTTQATSTDSEVGSGSPQNFTANAEGRDWGPLGPEVVYAMPDMFTDGINTLVDKIPGGASIQIIESKFAYRMKERDCCRDENGTTTIIPDGELQGDGTLSFKLAGRDLPIPNWHLPRVERKMSNALVEVEFVFEAGAFWDFEVALSGTGGRRESVCEEEGDCYYGNIDLAASVGVGVKIESIICTDTAWTDADCTGIDIVPAHVGTGLKGSMGWNQNSCAEGFSASASIYDVTVKAEFSIPGVISVPWAYTFSGFKLL
jgi:hypothetical protein